MSDEKEKKGYSIVDKRASGGETEEEPSRASDGASGAAAGEGAPSEQPPPEDGGRMMRVEELIALFLNLLRDQAALSLGMPLHPALKAAGNPETTGFVVSLFKKLMEKFGDKVFAGAQEVPEESLDLPGLILSYLGMLQEYILIHTGVLASPVTGVVARDLGQARLGIDLFSLVVEESTSIISPEELRRLEAVLSDLKINFARQSGL